MHDWGQNSQWRKTQRVELITRRSRFGIDERRHWNDVITERLIQGFPDLAGKTTAFCWPYKGEPDVRFAIRQFRERGARAALLAVGNPQGTARISPVVVWGGNATGRIGNSCSR